MRYINLLLTVTLTVTNSADRPARSGEASLPVGLPFTCRQVRARGAGGGAVRADSVEERLLSASVELQ